MINMNKKESGAVSLFVVIFAALLITIVTVSFIRLMVIEQQQASVTDVSQSAYDSALAGVEDAKRALLLYQDECEKGEAACDAAAVKFKEDAECNEAVVGLSGVDVKDEGVDVQTGDASSLSQSYTCVKVSLYTSDYLGYLNQNELDMIPLRGTDSFDTVRIKWFTSENAGSSTASLFTNIAKLYTGPVNRPPVLRTQVVQYGDDGFNLNDFDREDNGKSNTNTAFFYPVSASTTNKDLAVIDDRPINVVSLDTLNLPKEPVEVKCMTNLSIYDYSCSIDVKLPTPINSGNREGYLLLESLYNKTNYSVELVDSSKPTEVITFNAVQPSVDSTGRTNDLFRRVESRIDMMDINYPYPIASIHTLGNVCKDFTVTDSTDGYSNRCTP